MRMVVTVDVNLSHHTDGPATTTTTTAQVQELAKLDKMTTRWAAHLYTSRQCTQCGRPQHTTSIMWCKMLSISLLLFY